MLPTKTIVCWPYCLFIEGKMFFLNTHTFCLWICGENGVLSRPEPRPSSNFFPFSSSSSFFLHCRRKSIKKSWAWGRGRRGLLLDPVHFETRILPLFIK